MKTRLLKAYTVFCLLLSVFGCGDSGGGSSDGDTGGGTTPPTVIAEKLSVSTDRSTLDVDSSTDLATLTVITRDKNNVALGGAVVTFSATAGVLSASSITTDSTGTATVTLTVGPDKNAQVVTITVKSGSLSQVLAINFVKVSSGATKLDIVPDLYTLDISDPTAAAKLTITARNNDNVALAGVVVNLAATSGVLSTASVTTDSSGSATATFSPGPNATNKVVTITASSASLTAQIGITLVDRATRASKIDLTTDNPRLVIGSADSATLAITARDSDNILLDGIAVTLKTTGGALSTSKVTTDANGTAVAKFYLGPNAAPGVITLIATSGNLSTSLGITVVDTAATRLNITSDSYQLNTLNTADVATITVVTRDANNIALPGVRVSLTTTAGVLSTYQVTTDNLGKATVTFSPGPDTANQVATIRATAGSLSESVGITLVQAASNVKSLNLTADKTDLNVNAAESAVITIVTRDANNAVLGNVDVNLSATNGALSNAKVTTNATGTATVTFTPGPNMTASVATVTAVTEALSKSLNFNIVDDPGLPANLVMSSNLTPGAKLSQGGSMTVTATVTDAYGVAVTDGTLVNFTTTNGFVTATATTVNGKATATFQALNAAGTVTVTGRTVGTNNASISDFLDFEVATGTARSIVFVSAVPTTIGVKSSGLSETSTLTFQILDSGGNPVPDGTLIDFAIATSLAGGESVWPAQNATVGGLATVALSSGTVAGVSAVSATVRGAAVTTEAEVIIAAGLAEANHFSLATEKFNLPGYSCFGDTTKITAFVADRYGNPVPADTRVYFSTEAGAMALDASLTNDFGQASASHITQAPLPATPPTSTPDEALNTILAWTAGEEAFADLNGDGVYNVGEPFDDIGEPFIDANLNGLYEVGERYVDLNNNGFYTGPNGTWNGNTYVWDEIPILWSSSSAVFLTVTPDSNCPNLVVPDGGSCQVLIEAQDLNGNPVIGGSTLNLSAPTGGKIEPATFVIPDAMSPGYGTTQFVARLTNTAGGVPASAGVTAVLSIPNTNCGGSTWTLPFSVYFQ